MLERQSEEDRQQSFGTAQSLHVDTQFDDGDGREVGDCRDGGLHEHSARLLTVDFLLPTAAHAVQDAQTCLERAMGEILTKLNRLREQACILAPPSNPDASGEMAQRPRRTLTAPTET